MPLARKRAFYSGRVQGVGFRATTAHLARDFRVAGFVRNLVDGRVEVLAEGPLLEVDALLIAVYRAMGHRVRNVQVVSEPPADPPEAGFLIRYDSH